MAPRMDWVVRLLLAAAWLAIVSALWLVPPRSVLQLTANAAASYLLLWGVLACVSTGSLAVWRLRFLAVSLAIAFAVVLVEIPALLGVLDYRVVLGTLGDEPWRNPANRLDPVLLHVHQPHRRYQSTQGGDISFYFNLEETADYPFDVQTDANGFRNPQDLEQADVIVVGDSFIEAATVPADQMLTSVLAKDLGKTVANLGQLWYGPQQELEVLKRYGLPMQPSVCVWAFFEGNDLSDYRRYEDIHARWPQFSRSLHGFKQRLFVRNFSHAAFHLVGRPDDRESGERIKGMCSQSGNPMYFYYRSQPLSEDDFQTLQQVKTIFMNAWRLCQEQDVRFVVAMVPTKYRVYRDVCQFSDRSIYRFWQPNKLPDLLRETLAEISPEIGFIDLTEPLQQATRQGVQTYFPDDTHWTSAGNEVAARAISAYLSEQ